MRVWSFRAEVDSMRRRYCFAGIAASIAAAVMWSSAAAHAGEGCDNGSFGSTYELIQQAIFANQGCTTDLCHGSAAEGGLDLRPEIAYENLVDVPSQTVPGQLRILAGQKDESLFWVNLAAKTFPDEWSAPLRAMPLDPLPALSPDQIEALRLWIQAGAPKEGVVPDTDKLLDACLPPPEPLEIKPLPPPPPGTGVQIRMPQWILPARSEDEVCFASYYDVSSQVPASALTEDGLRFRYKRNQLRQDPLSHHLIVFDYNGTASPTDPRWGTYRCRGGDRDGQRCDPLDLDFCGEGSGCGTEPRPSIACIGFGPGDSGIGLSSGGVVFTQETASEFIFEEGVYNELPVRGIIMWNSHAFNLTDKPGKLEAWLNFEFAPLEEQKSIVRTIFNADQIFKTNAPAFGTDEPCSIHILQPNAHVFELSSHTHKRGKRFRIFKGAFRCEGGPARNEPCSPFGYDFASPDVCQGAPCTSTERVTVGDCNLDGNVTVDELVTCLSIGLGESDISQCRDADGDGDWQVAVDEIVTGVDAALNGAPGRVARDPDASLLYTSYVYNDPVILRFEPPWVMPGPGSANDDRTLTYCALYDNGFTNPDEVKRKSTSPLPPFQFPGIGGPCAEASHCTEGRVGQPCSGGNQSARDASCDTSAGAGDGRCDACTLRGGVTTEDEMFIPIGQYYIP
jgi:hypothetical protein